MDEKGYIILYNERGETIEMTKNYQIPPDAADYIIFQKGDYVFTKNGRTGEVKYSSTDPTQVFLDTFLNAEDGSVIYIAPGEYTLRAEYEFDTSIGSQPYTLHTAIPVTKNLTIKGAGMGKTVLKLADGQYSPERHVSLLHVVKDITSLHIEGITFDGNKENQEPDNFDIGLVVLSKWIDVLIVKDVEVRNAPGNGGLYFSYSGGGHPRLVFAENLYVHDNYSRGLCIDYCDLFICSRIRSKNNGKADIYFIAPLAENEATAYLSQVVARNMHARAYNKIVIYDSDFVANGLDDLYKLSDTLYIQIFVEGSNVKLYDTNVETHYSGTDDYVRMFRVYDITSDSTQLTASVALYSSTVRADLAAGRIFDQFRNSSLLCKASHVAMGGNVTLASLWDENGSAVFDSTRFDGQGTIYTSDTSTINFVNCSGDIVAKSGVATFSSDGTTTQFKIAHGLIATPSRAKTRVWALSADAAGSFWIDVDDTYIYVNYLSPPPSGTNNVVLGWCAEV